MQWKVPTGGAVLIKPVASGGAVFFEAFKDTSIVAPVILCFFAGMQLQTRIPWPRSMPWMVMLDELHLAQDQASRVEHVEFEDDLYGSVRVAWVVQIQTP